MGWEAIFYQYITSYLKAKDQRFTKIKNYFIKGHVSMCLLWFPVLLPEDKMFSNNTFHTNVGPEIPVQELQQNIDWLILIDWLIDFLIGRFIYFFIYSFIHLLIDWLIDWLVAWLIDGLIDWLIDWLIYLFIDLFVGWLVGWLIDWFIMINSIIYWLI